MNVTRENSKFSQTECYKARNHPRLVEQITF